MEITKEIKVKINDPCGNDQLNTKEKIDMIEATLIGCLKYNCMNFFNFVFQKTKYGYTGYQFQSEILKRDNIPDSKRFILTVFEDGTYRHNSSKNGRRTGDYHCSL